MAEKTKRKAKAQPADELAVSKKLDALKKQIGDNTPTAAQKQERDGLRAELGALKFTRLAKARMTKALKAIAQVKQLSGGQYVSTPEQSEKMCAALGGAVDAVTDAFDASKKGAEKTQGGFEF